jgi:THO complex subunit 4
MATLDLTNARTGQPIRITEVHSRSVTRRNPFDSAPRPGRSLADRVGGGGPRDRSRSRSPPKYTAEEAARKGIDRYVPGQRRSRSPRRDRGGRRPGARRDARAREGGDETRGGGGGGGGGRGSRAGREGRSRKTQEELDAEMDNYFGGDSKAPDNAAAAAAPAVVAVDDIDMIE